MGASRPAVPTQKRRLFVVPHTHWDREWYRPFEDFRARLVRLMDRLLDILKTDPEYEHFMLDGQSIILDDYLEIRPDRRADIERQVRSGRLAVGPWYVLPDEFLVGGESLVRNLQMGIAIARGFGSSTMVGYLPDMFGHIAYMPAILNGFDMSTSVLWRGVGSSVPTSEFFWRTADGSEVLVIHLPLGYGLGRGLPNERDALRNRLQSIRAVLEPWASTRCLLLMNGDDHLEPQPELPSIIALANESQDDVELVHDTLPAFIEAVQEEMGPASGSWPHVEGEFRSSQRASLLPSVASARMWIKQANQECENLLLRWAEPFSAWANLLRLRNGEEEGRATSDAGLLHAAWQLLLQNHAHDSICGCSIDEVHQQMATRFQRCRALGTAVSRESLRYIAGLAAPTGGPHVVVFNPLSGARSDVCTARLPLKDDREPLRVECEDGTQAPLQTLRRGLLSPADTGERAEVAFVAPDVPGHGYRAFRVVYGEPARRRRPSRTARAIENEHLRVEVDALDGTIALTDKTTGVDLRGLNRFVDGGDCGDEYNYCPPARDELVEKPRRQPRIRLVECGPARWTLEIVLDYGLPASLSRDEQGRSRRRRVCRIVSRVSVCANVPRVDIETTVDNQSEDHRLRVHFPTGLRVEVAHAEQHFGVVARPLALPESDGTWVETPQGTHPQKSFMDVNDGHRGLLLANRGLPEYEVIDRPGGATIALTLLRCVGWLSRPSLANRPSRAGPQMPTPEAQCPGRHVFHYSLVPHSGGWESAFVQAHRFAQPLRAVAVDGGAALLPPEDSLLTVRPNALVVSALKPAQDGRGVILRLYNITSEPVWGEVHFAEAHRSVERVNLNEDTLGPVEMDGDRVRLSAKPNEIITLRFR